MRKITIGECVAVPKKMQSRKATFCYDRLLHLLLLGASLPRAARAMD